jgi:hypothetical protein
MPNVITFTPRPRSVVLSPVPPLADIDLRAHLEEAAQTALDAADKIIAALDRIDAAADDGSEAADPSLIAKAAHAEQVFHLRVPQEAPQTVPPVEAALEPVPVLEPQGEQVPAQIEAQEIRLPPARLPWNGYGNVVSATGCAILALVARAKWGGDQVYGRIDRTPI